MPVSEDAADSGGASCAAPQTGAGSGAKELSLLHILNKLRDHPTADMVYEEVVREYPGISKATVYRNLNPMAKLGQIQKVQIPNSEDRYDFNLEKHYHFRCRGCGKVFDMKLTYMAALDDIDVGRCG